MEKLNDYLKLGRRWTKYGKDRVYIDAAKIRDQEFEGVPVRNYFNRKEWDNVSVYYDIDADDIVVTTGDNKAKAAVAAIVAAMI